MRIRIVTSLLMVVIALTAVPVSGQTTSMPMPGAVVKDADGKVVGQLSGVDGGGDLEVILNIEGVPAAFDVFWWGLRSLGNRGVHFSESGCTGSAYVQPLFVAGIERLTQVKFVVLGPDPTQGTYRMFRSTSVTPAMVDVMSMQFANEDCQDGSNTFELVEAAEVTPNPLEGFHGPTLAHPERTWTIEGGDRLQ